MKKIYKILLPIALVAIAYGLYYVYSYIGIGSSYLAKYVCSSVFVTGRSDQQAIADAVIRMELFNIYDIEIDHNSKEVHVTLFGFANRTAVYREGLGATLLIDMTAEQLRQQSAGWQKPAIKDSIPEWPLINHEMKIQYDSLKLHKALDDAFNEPHTDQYPRNTYAVIIADKNRIIAERYAPGFDSATPLLGWSMSKSIINALVGVLVEKGKININNRLPMSEWADDAAKQKITWNHALQMNSGLNSNEDYGNPFSTVLQMLYNSPDMGGLAAAQTQIHEPGVKWYYSSGTTNIIAKAIKYTFGKNLFSYWTFAYEQFFNRIGMKNCVFEVDESGTFVGSSYLYASARDWIKFGLLYLNNGKWGKQQILTEDWIAYSVSPVPGDSQGRYGAQWWLNIGPEEDPEGRWMPELPDDLFAARGHDGQYLTIIPSRQLVILRMGNTPFPGGWSQKEFLNGILSAFKSTH